MPVASNHSLPNPINLAYFRSRVRLKQSSGTRRIEIKQLGTLMPLSNVPQTLRKKFLFPGDEKRTSSTVTVPRDVNWRLDHAVISVERVETRQRLAGPDEAEDRAKRGERENSSAGKVWEEERREGRLAAA